MADEIALNGLHGLLTPKAAARYIGMSTNVFRQWAKKSGPKKLPRYQLGTRVFFKRDDLDSWLESFRKK